MDHLHPQYISACTHSLRWRDNLLQFNPSVRLGSKRDLSDLVQGTCNIPQIRCLPHSDGWCARLDVLSVLLRHWLIRNVHYYEWHSSNPRHARYKNYRILQGPDGNKCLQLSPTPWVNMRPFTPSQLLLGFKFETSKNTNSQNMETSGFCLTETILNYQPCERSPQVR